jgi:hypothetical protein
MPCSVFRQAPLPALISWVKTQALLTAPGNVLMIQKRIRPENVTQMKKKSFLLLYTHNRGWIDLNVFESKPPKSQNMELATEKKEARRTAHGATFNLAACSAREGQMRPRNAGRGWRYIYLCIHTKTASRPGTAPPPAPDPVRAKGTRLPALGPPPLEFC